MSTAVARTREESIALAKEASALLEGKTSDKIVEWAAAEFGERFCVTSSFADAVLAHVVSKVVPGVPVIFLDTGLHFAETLRVREVVQRTLPVTVRSIRPRQTVTEQDAEFGPRLYARDPDECCFLRKIEPLERALEDYDAWAAGLRRDESPSRANTPIVSFEQARSKFKVSPLAQWSRPTSTRTSRGTTCRSTRSCGRATPRLAAGRAPGGPLRAATRAAGAGRCSTRPSAACTPDDRWSYRARAGAARGARVG